MNVKKIVNTVKKRYHMYLQQWPYNKNESLCNVSVSVIIIVGPGFDHKFRLHETMALVDELVGYLFLSLEKLCG